MISFLKRAFDVLKILFIVFFKNCFEILGLILDFFDITVQILVFLSGLATITQLVDHLTK